MTNLPARPGAIRAFTLIELLCVISIIALLAGLLTPSLQQAKKRAQSAACFGNLRQIGVAVNLYIADHDNTYPAIETDPTNPILYADQTDIVAKPMLDTFQPYGVTPKTLQCPSDVSDPNFNYYALKGTSYEWRPMLDLDNKLSPIVISRRGAFAANPARVRQVTDYNPVHNGRMNALYGDGHVRWF